MKRKPSLPVLAGAAILLALGALSALAAESAAARFAAEAKRLEAEMAAAEGAWDEQQRLVDDVVAAARKLEAAVASPDATTKELRALEDRYAVALDAVYRQARQTSDSRRRVYDAMDRLAEAGRRVEEERQAARDVPVPGGLWRIELPEGNLTGLMRLEADGTAVRGDYRLSNGRHGAVAGSYVGGLLDLVRVDSRGGRDASLTAKVDEGQESLAGTWLRFELSTGEPATGTWTGVRIGPGEEVPELSPE